MKLTVQKGTQTDYVDFEHPTLLSCLLEGNNHLAMPCGGKGRCLKCKVQVRGVVSTPSQNEQNLLSLAEIKSGFRFACMTTVLGDATVTLSAAKDQKILTTVSMPQMKLCPWGESFGVAIDIGTTTVAAYLYNLKSGELLHSTAKINPQTAFGADVITRIEKALGGNQQLLSAAITGCINELLVALCASTPIPLNQIDCIAITGNTAMLYLLTARSPGSLATAPFITEYYFGEFLSSKELGFVTPNAKVYLSRCISSYVGGDITTAILSSEIAASRNPTLLVDIGTNGEMALCVNGKITCCSTAAGPAFEGAGISMGMPAVDGAISHVTFNKLKFTYDVIGNTSPVGLCGSGIIDAVAAMLNAGIIEETGYLLPDGHHFEEYVTEDGFTLPGTSARITQADIRAIQLGKSAICAGITTLLHEAGVTPDQLDKLIIAGGFGSYMDVVSAERIGLIPKGFSIKSVSIGNAAATGAAMILLNQDLLHLSEEISQRCESLELSTNAYFMDEYINNMMF